MSNKPVDNILGCRYEIKYLVSEAKAQALARFVELYLPLDYYSKSRPSGDYPIATLYLDSHDLQLCRESLEGHKNRFKLRIRSYTDEPNQPCFVEIKRRMNTIIIKDRARVKRRNIANLLSGLSLPPQDYSTDQETLKQFRLYMNTINARPVINIRYMRRAYEDTSGNRVRVTFDRQLAFKANDTADVQLNGNGWLQHSLEGVIFEVKFTNYYPAWIGQMIKCFGLRQRPVSKYTYSIQKSCVLKFCAPKVPIRIYQQ